MRFVFTPGIETWDAVVRWALNEPVDHCAVVSHDNKVFSCELDGVKMESLESFLSSHKIIFALDLAFELSPQEEDEIFAECQAEAVTRPYDILGAVYFGVRLALLRLLAIPLPAKNSWEESGTFMCTQGVALVASKIFIRKNIALMPPTGIDYAMTGPFKIHQLMLESGQVREVQLG